MKFPRNTWKKLVNFFVMTADDKVFVRWLGAVYRPGKGPRKRVLVDFSHLGFKKWTFQTGISLTALSRENNIEVIGFYPSAFFLWRATRPRLLWLLKMFYNKDSQFMRGFRVQDVLAPSYLRYWASRIGKSRGQVARTKEDVLALQVNGVNIGDLLYDTYLKRYRTPTIDPTDKRLSALYGEACFLAASYEEFLDRAEIDEIWLTHSVYLAYGILARLALRRGIDVFCVQNNGHRLFRRLTEDEPLQRGGFSEYRKVFATLPDKERRLKKGREILEARISGNLDQYVSYMKYSAYGTADTPIALQNNGRPNVVLMFHCFFDSPHIYRSMLFPDFFEWAAYTIRELIKLNYNVFIKPHPNGLKGNDKVVRSLTDLFESVHILPPEVNNRQIASSFDAAITVYGTVGHELPALGVPVITAGDCPYADYDFCFHAKSLPQYSQLLKSIPDLRLQLPEDYKDQLYEFMYMLTAFEHRGTARRYSELYGTADNFCPYKNLIERSDNPDLLRSCRDAHASA